METLHHSESYSQPALPVRRLHNYVYCPRLFYFQWVENIFVENADTVAGTAAHKRVDVPTAISTTDPAALPEGATVRSLELFSETLGLVGIIDLVETSADGVEIIDYKKGSSFRDDQGTRVAKPPDAIQLAAHALLLKEEGIEVRRGWVYYAAERRKVEVTFTQALLDECQEQIKQAKRLAASRELPPPLINDPRCLYCSLYPVCLPQESAYWSVDEPPPVAISRPPRPEKDSGEILIVQKPGARIGVRGGQVEVRHKDDHLASLALNQLMQVHLFGAVQMSEQAAQCFLESDIPVAYFSPAGRYLGALQGLGASGTEARRGQYRLYEQPAIRLRLAQEAIRAKIHNQRVMLMRNGQETETAVEELKRLRNRTGQTTTIEEVRGLEGCAAAIYFGNFAAMLRLKGFDFDFNGRNRRPPKDPVNALLSLGYSMLAKELAGLCHTIGLDPFLGFFHEPRYGRPALALDMMEEFRPLIADSVAISLLNRRELASGDFMRTSKGVFLNESGRRTFWAAYFRRMDTEVTHPQFGYTMSYRRMMEVQVRQFWRYVRGEARHYHGFTTR
jgi:CRISPR-associated protein Cas1